MNPLLFHKDEENALQNMSLAAYASETNNVNAKGGLQNSGLQFFFLQSFVKKYELRIRIAQIFR